MDLGPKNVKKKEGGWKGREVRGEMGRRKWEEGEEEEEKEEDDDEDDPCLATWNQ